MTSTKADSATLQAARRLRESISTLRAATESKRRVPPPIVEAMMEAGLFRLAVPRADGGLEAAPVETLQVYEELARAEASVAWIAWNCSLPALVSRLLAPAARHALFSDPRAIHTSSTRPTGRALRTTGGFQVSGRWSLVSGCELASHFLLRCVVESESGAAPTAPPELVMAYLPRTQCRIEDTWHVGGLRGTGSHDVVADQVVVPGQFAVSFSDAPHLHGPLYRMPFAATLSAGCAAICLGIGVGAVETLLALARVKTPVDTGRAPLREQPTLQIRVAKLKSALAAARLLLHSTLENAFEDCTADRSLALERCAAIFGAAQFAAVTAKDVVREAYEAAGTAALYVDCPLERAHRDIHAATQHIILNETWLQDSGRVWLGLEPAIPLFAW